MAVCPHCRTQLPAGPLLWDALYNLCLSMAFGPQASAMGIGYRQTCTCPNCHLELKLEIVRPHTLGLLAGLTDALRRLDFRHRAYCRR